MILFLVVNACSCGNDQPAQTNDSIPAKHPTDSSPSVIIEPEAEEVSPFNEFISSFLKDNYTVDSLLSDSSQFTSRINLMFPAKGNPLVKSIGLQSVKSSIIYKKDNAAFPRFKAECYTYNDSASAAIAVGNYFSTAHYLHGQTYGFDLVFAYGKEVYWLHGDCGFPQVKWELLCERLKEKTGEPLESISCRCGGGCLMKK